MRTLIASLLSTSALLGAVTIAGCVTPTGNIDADTKAFATEVQAFNQNATTVVASAASGAITDVVAVGKAVCANANELHGLYQATVPVQAVLGVDPTVGATEAGAYLVAQINCEIIDAADPKAPTTTVAAAASAVVNALPQIKQALTASAPDVAAIALAPVPVVAKAS